MSTVKSIAILAVLLCSGSVVYASQPPAPGTPREPTMIPRFQKERVESYGTRWRQVASGQPHSCNKNAVSVRIEVQVDEYGRVQQARIIGATPDAEQNEAALVAARGLRYQPRIVEWEPQAFTDVLDRAFWPRGPCASATGVISTGDIHTSPRGVGISGDAVR